jgi:hypothetical protein
VSLATRALLISVLPRVVYASERLSCLSDRPHVRPIKNYSSIFKNIQGIFEEYSKNRSNMFNV